MEYFDILNPDGTPAGQIKERTLVHMDGDLHGTAHIWIIRPSLSGSFELLLQKRSHNKDAFPDCYDISSAGHLSAGQEFLEGAIRELYEELGILASQADLTFIGLHHGFVGTSFYGSPFNNNELSAVYLYSNPIDISSLTLQEEEVSSVRWMEFSECLQHVQEYSPEFCIFLDELQMLEPKAKELLHLSA